MATLSPSTGGLGLDMIPSMLPVLDVSAVACAGLFLILFQYVYKWLRSIYRLYFHPLAGFPGPRNAAVSRDWEHRIATEKGAYPEKVYEMLHKQYDTHALRIGPNELHINDVKLYKIIYGQNTKYYKDPFYYAGFSAPHTLFAQSDPQAHRALRKMLSPPFSRAGIFKIERLIHDKYEMVESKILRLSENGSKIDVYDAFRALTTEIVAQWAFSRPAGLIEQSPYNFKAHAVQAIEGTADGTEFMRHHPVIRTITENLPRRFMAKFGGDIRQFMNVLDYAEESVDHWEKHKGEVDHPVMFDVLKGVSHNDLSLEALAQIIAGGDTTASTLTYATIAITGDPKIHQRLVSELEAALNARGRRRGERLPLRELEDIPYLMAVVKESVRCAVAQPARLPRVVPAGAEPLVVDGKVVPPGTIVGMSAYSMNMSEEIFGPDAWVFNPERWLQPDSKQLAEQIYTFSKGPRICLGINLAYAELTIIIARLFSNLKVSRPSDFQEPVVRDHFTASYSPRGVQFIFQAV